MSSVITRDDGTMVITVRITLKPGLDDALMAAIQDAPPRRLAAVIRQATRTGLRAVASTEDEVNLLDHLDAMAIDL